MKAKVTKSGKFSFNGIDIEELNVDQVVDNNEKAIALIETGWADILEMPKCEEPGDSENPDDSKKEVKKANPKK